MGFSWKSSQTSHPQILGLDYAPSSSQPFRQRPRSECRVPDWPWCRRGHGALVTCLSLGCFTNCIILATLIWLCLSFSSVSHRIKPQRGDRKSKWRKRHNKERLLVLSFSVLLLPNSQLESLAKLWLWDHPLFQLTGQVNMAGRSNYYFQRPAWKKTEFETYKILPAVNIFPSTQRKNTLSASYASTTD